MEDILQVLVPIIVICSVLILCMFAGCHCKMLSTKVTGLVVYSLQYCLTCRVLEHSNMLVTPCRSPLWAPAPWNPWK